MFLRNAGLMASAGLAAGLAVGSGAGAAIVVYDDAPQSGWTVTDWYVSQQGENVHQGTMALGTTNGLIQIKYTDGYTPAPGSTVLTFWVNSNNDGPITGMILAINGTDRTSDQYVQNGSSATRYTIDADSSTWEKVEWDAAQLGGTPIETLAFKKHWSGTGLEIDQLVDTISFVPEPASLSVLGMGLGAMLLRRRR